MREDKTLTRCCALSSVLKLFRAFSATLSLNWSGFLALSVKSIIFLAVIHDSCNTLYANAIRDRQPEPLTSILIMRIGPLEWRSESCATLKIIVAPRWRLTLAPRSRNKNENVCFIVTDRIRRDFSSFTEFRSVKPPWISVIQITGHRGRKGAPWNEKGEKIVNITKKKKWNVSILFTSMCLS